VPASADQVEVSGTAFVDVGVKAHGSGPPRYALGRPIQSAIAKTVPPYLRIFRVTLFAKLLQNRRQNRFADFGQVLERAKGIEPSYAAWEAAVLPLNYARKILI
jgi:hypothetical protein